MSGYAWREWNPFESQIKQAIKVQVSTNVSLNHPISKRNPQNPPGTLCWASDWPFQRKALRARKQTPNKFRSLHCVTYPNKTFPMRWYQTGFGRERRRIQCCRLVRAVSKAASSRSEVILLNHPLKRIVYKAPNNFITTYIKGRAVVLLKFVGDLEAICEPLCCSSSRFLRPLVWPAVIAGFCFLFSPLCLLFVSLPVFIKLVKFPLQLCQPCIMLRCSHPHALQLPGNRVWRRRVPRQRTPSDEK